MCVCVSAHIHMCKKRILSKLCQSHPYVFSLSLSLCLFAFTFPLFVHYNNLHWAPVILNCKFSSHKFIVVCFIFIFSFILFHFIMMRMLFLCYLQLMSSLLFLLLLLLFVYKPKKNKKKMEKSGKNRHNFIKFLHLFMISLKSSSHVIKLS